MRILLTNDDGIWAPGLRMLACAMKENGFDVTVSAPDRQRSAVSHGLTVFEPLRAIPADFSGVRAFEVSGTPADCVKLGVDALADGPVDLVVSGINRGANQGTNCAYSGTVGAATEAAMLGYPALATSFCDYRTDDYGAAVRMTLRVVGWMPAHPLPAGCLYNLNTPALAYDEIRGVILTRLAPKLYEESGYERYITPQGLTCYWLKDRPVNDFARDTDVWATNAGYASLTALTWDRTCPCAPDCLP